MYEKERYDLNRLILHHESIIEAYSRMIPDVEDEDLKSRLRSNQENHFRQMMVLSDRVYELGGVPKFETGVLGVMDDIRHHKSKKTEMTDLENARAALDTEKVNIDRLSAFGSGDIDNTSLELIQMGINSNSDNIHSLEEYINHKELQ